MEHDTWLAQVQGALARSNELIAAGGPVVVLLLALSVLAMAIVMAKLWQLAAAGLGQRRALAALGEHCRRGDAARALRDARSLRGPAGAILANLIEGLQAGREESRLRESGTAMVADLGEGLRSWMRPLEVIAALAPLIGLFGTVLGMIEAFAQLEAAGSQVNPAILSGGIWVALLTTAVGLAVAIPTVAAFNWLERRIERFEHGLAMAMGAVLAAPPPTISADDPSLAAFRRPLAASGR